LTASPLVGADEGGAAVLPGAAVGGAGGLASAAVVEVVVVVVLAGVASFLSHAASSSPRVSAAGTIRLLAFIEMSPVETSSGICIHHCGGVVTTLRMLSPGRSCLPGARNQLMEEVCLAKIPAAARAQQRTERAAR
jgi:hypothetical protein